jgi:hypothetical protein
MWCISICCIINANHDPILNLIYPSPSPPHKNTKTENKILIPTLQHENILMTGEGTIRAGFVFKIS